MFVNEIRDEIGRLLGDPNHQKWSDTTITARINQAQVAVMGYTNAVKTKESLTPVSGTSNYVIDEATMDIIRVHIKNSSGEWKKIDGILRDQLDFENPGWRQLDDGEPLAYWWDGTNQEINLVPAPSSEWAQTDGMEVWEVQIPTDMAVGVNGVPFNSLSSMIPYHMTLVHWVVAQCFMDDGTPEAFSKSKFHRSDDFSHPGKFETEIKKIWKKFDSPEDIPARILWRPEGGRATANGAFDRKSNPLS